MRQENVNSPVEKAPKVEDKVNEVKPRGRQIIPDEADTVVKRKIVRSDGTEEEGKFENNKLHGQGKRVSKDDELGKITEIGNFVEGVFNGQGRSYTSDGTEWIGEFEAGKLKKGKILRYNGTEEGEFKDGKLHGPGKRINSNFEDGKTVNTVEEGEFNEGVLTQV